MLDCLLTWSFERRAIVLRLRGLRQARQGEIGCVFIIFGSPRSGTTLLAQSLDAHSRIVVPHETDFIIPSAFLFDRVADAEIRKRLLSDLIVHSRLFPGNIGEFLSPEEVREIVWRCGDQMSALLLGIYAAIAAKGNGVIAGDKSPNDLNFLRMLDKVGGLNSGIRIIHIVRDIRDVMGSLLPLNWTSGLDSYFPRLWSYSNLYLRSLHGNRPEYLLVKYEEFVQSPEGTLKRICEHLETDFEREQLSTDRRHRRYQGQPVHAKLYQPITPSTIGGFREILKPDLIESIERQAADAMKIFGYDFLSPFGQAYQALP